MSTNLEMLGPEDRPALVAVTTQDLREIAQGTLSQIGYKVHVTEDHEDFVRRFAQFQYQVVVLEEHFAGSAPGENTSLKTLQTMAMPLRRLATVLLIGPSFRTLDAMQGFGQSVHAVIHPDDMGNFPTVLQKVISDNELFLGMVRAAQANQGRAK